MVVASAVLDEAPSTGREIVGHSGFGDGQLIEVNDVDVGFVSRRQHAPIVEAVGHCRVLCLLFHKLLKGDSFAAFPVLAQCVNR